MEKISKTTFFYNLLYKISCHIIFGLFFFFFFEKISFDFNHSLYRKGLPILLTIS